MNDISFSEDDFSLIILAFGGLGILISALLFTFLDLHTRRSREMEILRTSQPISEARRWAKGQGNTEAEAARQIARG